MLTRTDKRLRFQMCFMCVVVLAGCATAQITGAKPPDPNISAPGPQRHGAPAQPQPQRPGARAQQPVLQAPGNGVIEGFVYWDTGAITHQPAGSCSGLAVTVSVPNGLSGPFQGYKPLATLTNNFKYVGQVKAMLTGGKILTYDVCTYGYSQVPVGIPVQVQLTVPQLTAFSPTATPQPSQIAAITIINAQCNMLPSLNPTTLADLTTHWGTCQNMAYDVNFVLQHSVSLHTQSASGTSASSPSHAGAQRNPGPAGAPLLKDPGPGGMLAAKNSGSAGMLQQVTPAPIGTPSTKDPGPPGMPSSKRVAVGLRTTVKLKPPRQSRKINNPQARLQDQAIIAVLRKQSQAATAEAAAMKLGIRAAGNQIGAGPSRTMAATTLTGRASSAPTSTGAVSVGSVGHSGAVSSLLPSQFQNLAITCSQDPSMRVLSISGGPTPVIFTPDPKYNFYTITGCSFGSPGTNSKVYIYYQGAFHEDFQVQEWSDNWIKLSLDQNISGVDDQNSVVLVVQRDDGKQWTKQGYKFYAVRQTVQLAPIPQPDFSLNRFRPDSAVTQSWKPTYTSASSSGVTPNLPGLSAEVHWDITADPDGSLVGGTDIYDLSHLHSTFVLDSAWMQWRDVSCTDPDFNQFAASKNNWSLDWYGASGVQVGWQGQICKNTPGSCGGAFQGDCFANSPESNYGVSISVTGPRGIDPWSGKPTS
jgi:hypothetical protein